MALCIGESALPKAYLQKLENVYGNVTGSEELYVQLLETHENSNKMALDYLFRLHSLLQGAVACGVLELLLPTPLIPQPVGAWLNVSC